MAVFILTNEFSQVYSGYERTLLFKHYRVASLNISIIEAFSLVILFLIAISSFQLNKLRISKTNLFIILVFLVIICLSAINGIYRLGVAIAGLSELKSFLLLLTFIIIWRRVYSYENDLFIFLPAILLFVRVVYELVKYVFFPYVDSMVGIKTNFPTIGLIYLPIFLAAIFLDRSKIRKFFLSLLVALLILTVILSLSRTNIFISLISSIFVLSYFIFKLQYKRLSLLKFNIISTLVLLVLIVLMTPFIKKYSDFATSYFFWENNYDIAQTPSNVSHLHDIIRGFILISKSPFIGIGLGGQLPEFETAIFSGLIHNEFLHFWLCFGFAGAILWAYIFILLPIRAHIAFDKIKLIGYLKPKHFILFTIFPYIFTKATVSPPFYFSSRSIFLVAIIIVAQLILIENARFINVRKEKK